MKTCTPGIRVALCHRSVAVQSVDTPLGFMKMTCAVKPSRNCDISVLSSATLARVHGQRGWFNITSVGAPAFRASVLVAGHVRGAAAGSPGELLYLVKAAKPPIA